MPIARNEVRDDLRAALWEARAFWWDIMLDWNSVKGWINGERGGRIIEALWVDEAGMLGVVSLIAQLESEYADNQRRDVLRELVAPRWLIAPQAQTEGWITAHDTVAGDWMYLQAAEVPVDPNTLGLNWVSREAYEAAQPEEMPEEKSPVAEPQMEEKALPSGVFRNELAAGTDREFYQTFGEGRYLVSASPDGPWVELKQQPAEPKEEKEVKRPAGPEAWKRITLPAGIVVYHVTTVDSALNIARTGIRPVENQFGGGRLGAGFYTHTNAESAGLYVQAREVTLRFSVTAGCAGRSVPQSVPWVGTLQVDYVAGNAFLTPEEDEGRELKFHGGSSLTLTHVIQGGTEYPLRDWLALAGEDDEE